MLIKRMKTSTPEGRDRSATNHLTHNRVTEWNMLRWKCGRVMYRCVCLSVFIQCWYFM